MFLRWLRRWFGQRNAKPGNGPALPDDLWQATLEKYLFLQDSDAAAGRRLRSLVDAFLDQKEFFGAHDLAVTDAMAVSVAAQACLPLVHLASGDDPAKALRWYDDFVGIVLQPGEVRARREVLDEAGVVHAWDEALTGEAMDGGPVMLSWADVETADVSAAQGYNVVIHEFAHKLDMRDGLADGCPPLPPGIFGTCSAAAARRHWLDVLNAEHQSFIDQVSGAERFPGLVPTPWMDPYAAESPGEFFAVATEAFFVNPAALRQHSPALHELLRQFFRPSTSR